MRNLKQEKKITEREFRPATERKIIVSCASEGTHSALLNCELRNLDALWPGSLTQMPRKEGDYREG